MRKTYNALREIKTDSKKHQIHLSKNNTNLILKNKSKKIK